MLIHDTLLRVEGKSGSTTLDDLILTSAYTDLITEQITLTVYEERSLSYIADGASAWEPVMLGSCLYGLLMQLEVGNSSPTGKGKQIRS